MAFQVGTASGLTHRSPTRRPRPDVPSGRADLHVHSSWSDGADRPEALVRAAAGRMDVLAITDHDEIHGARLARDYAREHPELGVEVVVGEEISTRNGHLIGLWLDEAVPPGLPADETIDRIHAQGGLAVAAHPFHPIRGADRGQYSVGHLVPDLALDAIEIVNNAGVFSRVYDAWAALRNVEWMLPVTAGSDAHHVWYVGSALTRFEGRSADDLRAALVAGATRAQVHWTWNASTLPRHLTLQVRAGVRFLRRPSPRVRAAGALPHLTGGGAT